MPEIPSAVDTSTDTSTPVTVTQFEPAGPEKKRRIPSIHEVMNAIVEKAVPKPDTTNMDPRKKMYVDNLHHKDSIRLIIRLQTAVGERNIGAEPTKVILEDMQAILRGDGNFLAQLPFSSFPEAAIQATHAYIEALKKEAIEPGVRPRTMMDDVHDVYASTRESLRSTVSGLRDKVGATITTGRQLVGTAVGAVMTRIRRGEKTIESAASDLSKIAEQEVD